MSIKSTLILINYFTVTAFSKSFTICLLFYEVHKYLYKEILFNFVKLRRENNLHFLHFVTTDLKCYIAFSIKISSPFTLLFLF